MKMPLTASQTIATIAIGAVLLAGAYAIGRKQGDVAPAMAVAPTEETVVAQAAPPVALRPVMTEPAPVVATAPAPARLCSECARVVEVRSELRQGEASGVGAIGGALVGGLLGNQIGGGNGRKIATVGAAVAGGYAGNEIEKNRNQQRVWVVRFTDREGVTQRHQQSDNPHLRVGDVIVVRDGRIERRNG